MTIGLRLWLIFICLVTIAAVWAQEPEALGEYSGVPIFGNPAAVVGKGAAPYQCVDFVKRFCAQVHKVTIPPGTGNARDYFVRLPERLGFTAFVNGGNVPPKAGDILCFDDGGYGHVAIVKEVSAQGLVRIVEQNWPPANHWTDVLTLEVDSDLQSLRYTIPPRGRRHPYTCQGWLRPPDTNISSATTTGLDLLPVKKHRFIYVMKRKARQLLISRHAFWPQAVRISVEGRVFWQHVFAQDEEVQTVTLPSDPRRSLRYYFEAFHQDPDNGWQPTTRCITGGTIMIISRYSFEDGLDKDYDDLVIEIIDNTR